MNIKVTTRTNFSGLFITRRATGKRAMITHLAGHLQSA
jgi:hypothetical protein